MNNINDIKNQFIKLYNSKCFIKDRTGSNCLELLNTQFTANESSIFGKPNEDYIQRELEWYKSQSLNVNDIPGKTPTIWIKSADKDGFINSNYGWCIFNKENYNQYDNVVHELSKSPDSRRAQMIYTRPNMWSDYRKNDRNDFMCTSNTQHFIRNYTLMYTVIMRSNDSIFGFMNDLAWHEFVFRKMYEELKKKYPKLKKDKHIVWNATSLQIYDRHFSLIEDYISG